jgi:WD40 repeat protein/energy-coupling factor transporter ATP-binding protein EcfA2
VGNENYDVFVSYSRADGRHAADIDSVLRDKGLKTFFDRRNLAPGLPWVRALEQAIGASKAAIVLIGPRGFGNTQQYERDLALVRQTQDRAFPVVPVILPGTTTDPPFDFLRVLTWIDFSHVLRVSDAPDVLEHLLTAVRGAQTPVDTEREAICPYRGLDAFREEDSAFFFGRGSADDPESPVGQLVRKVREQPFVMVVGRSGSGKSSLIFAGLLPALRRERDRFWNVLSLRPGPTPLRALAAAFNPRAEGEGAAEYATKIGNEADKLGTGDPDLLAHMIYEELDQAEGKPDRLLLYIDQWEELYAQGSSTSDKERSGRHVADVTRFVDLLLNATRSAPVTVVATVRADFYDPLIGHQEMRALLPTRQVLLGSMPRSELERTIVEPAKKVGLAFDPPSLVQSILDEAGEDEGMLPLLQYALKETWALRRGNAMTADSYARSGGVREAIRITAERTFEALPPEDQQAARQLFLRLVTPGEGQEDTRARAAMPPEPAQRKIVEQFAGPRTRLLVTGWNRALQPTVEVAHEALIRTWPRLREWIDANREKLRARAAILQAKAEWEQQGQRADLLLPTGFQLERARALLAEPGDLSVADIREFIALSSAHEKRRQRLLVAACLAVTLVTAALGVFAFLQKHAADVERNLAVTNAELAEANAKRALENEKRAQSRLLATLSTQSVAASDAVSGMLLGLEALPDPKSKGARPYLPEAEEALFNALNNQTESVVLKGAADFSPDGKHVLTVEDKISRIRDAKTGLEIAVLQGHTDTITYTIFSPDGTRIATASRDDTVRIWASDTGAELKVLKTARSSNIDFSPDGTRILISSADRSTRIWDVGTGRETVLQGQVGNAKFSPDGNRVVGRGSSPNELAVWDASTGQELLILQGHTEDAYAPNFSPDGALVSAGSNDQTARIWDIKTGETRAILRGHTHVVWQAVFSPDGARVLTASNDFTARLWDAKTGEAGPILKGHAGWVTRAAFSADSKRIITTSWDQTARIWDAATGTELSVLRGHNAALFDALFSPDGKYALTSAWDGTARLWFVEESTTVTPISDHTANVFGVEFSPDGARIITGSSDGTVRVAATDTGHNLHTIFERRGAPQSFRLSPDGTRILITSSDGTARIWNAVTGQEMNVLTGHEGPVTGGAFNGDGTRVVTRSADKTARVWDAGTGRQIAVLPGHEEAVAEAVFSPDGSVIVTMSKGKPPRVWNTAEGKLTGILIGHEKDVSKFVFSQDGSQLVTLSLEDGIARVWKLKTAEQAVVLRANAGYITNAVFSHDGRRVVTSHWDGTVRIWDANTGAALLVLRGHEERVWEASFNASETRILTASLDRTARLWDAATGTAVAVFKGHAGSVWSARFSPDNEHVLTWSADSTARLWNASTGAEIGVLRTRGYDVVGAMFNRQGTRVATRNSDNVVRIWRVFKSTAELIDQAKAHVPRCLTPDEREKASLEREPPDWCVEQQKWPYNDETWTQWLVERNGGRKPKMPAIKTTHRTGLQ